MKRTKIMHDKWNKKYKGNHYYVKLMREKKAREDKVTHFKDGAVIVNPTEAEMYIHTR